MDPKIAIDKSPRTVIARESLERAYRYHPDAYYLHLTRHPISCGRSMRDEVSRNSEWEGVFTVDAFDPERVWLRSHQNIVDFTATLPLGQCMRIKGEDLLSEPWVYLPQIAEWLGVSTENAAIEAMLHPEHSPYACYGPESAKYGLDASFLEQPKLRQGNIEEPSLYSELPWAQEKFLGKQSHKFAKEFGYH